MKQTAVIFDIDGTLADISHRKHFITETKSWDAFYRNMDQDAPKTWACFLCKELSKADNLKILFVTGRPEDYREDTIRWLSRWQLIGGDYALLMRPKGDHRQDYEVKSEMYRQQIEPRYSVKLVLEDRTQVVNMWRSLGIETWQVEKGDF